MERYNSNMFKGIIKFKLFCALNFLHYTILIKVCKIKSYCMQTKQYYPRIIILYCTRVSSVAQYGTIQSTEQGETI